MRWIQRGGGLGTSCMDGVGDDGTYCTDDSYDSEEWSVACRATRASAGLTRVCWAVGGVEEIEMGELLDISGMVDMPYLW
jgi:hypothetical protein